MMPSLSAGRSSAPKQALRRASLKPLRLEWFIAMFVLLIQQTAFISIQFITHEVSKSEDQTARVTKRTDPVQSDDNDNPFNLPCLIASMLLITIFSIPRMRRVGTVVVNNPFVFIYIALLLASALWSLHPDSSIKRGIGYFISMSIAVYISTAFPINDCIKVLSYSFIISAVGSIVFVCTFPNLGIMWEPTLEGDWRGVFTHKNGLGGQMAIGLFTQLYLLAARIGRTGWRIFWVIVFFGLVLLSNSGTALTISVLYLVMFFLYIVWLQHKILAYAVAALVALSLVGISIALFVDPDSILGLLGKDATLTGRTYIWAEIPDLISQKPLLGWGYRASFVPGDPITDVMWARIGWETPGTHNSFLQITLDVGFVGLFLMIIIIITALWRGLRCCLTGVLPLGYFSLVLFIGVLINSLTEGYAIGQNQDPGWLIFNMLAFACGQSLSSRQGKRPARSPAYSKNS